MPFGHGAVRPDWLAQRTEAPLGPASPVVDAHHHFFDHPEWRYLAAELTADLEQAPDVVATVFVECDTRHRTDGPAVLRPVGETGFVAELAAELDRRPGGPRVAAGIVGHVDLTAGPSVEDALAAHLVAGRGRFRGVRQRMAWDPDPAVTHPQRPPPPGLYGSAAFRAGFAALARTGLTFDAWCYHPQLGEVAALARAFPDTVVVLDHCGGPLGVGRYARARSEVFEHWRAAMTDLATCENVHVKLGGLGMRSIGNGLDAAPLPPTSQQLAAVMRPWVTTTVELFGAGRCLFESNFPMDKASYGYGTFWNACRRLTADASADERAALLAGTASRVYGLAVDETRPATSPGIRRVSRP